MSFQKLFLHSDLALSKPLQFEFKGLKVWGNVSALCILAQFALEFINRLNQDILIAFENRLMSIIPGPPSFLDICLVT